MNSRRAVCVAAMIFIGGALPSIGQNPAPGRDGAALAAEIQKAERIPDPEARLKALLRIKAPSPGTTQAARLEGDILEARIDLAQTVEAVLALQRPQLGQARGTSRMTIYVQAAARILDHPRFPVFDPARVLAAVLDYRGQAERAAREPETFAATPDPADRGLLTARMVRDFAILGARALAHAERGEEALAFLEAYREAGGEAGPEYFRASGDACAALGRIRDAYGFYMSAAIENQPGAAEKARAAYVTIHGDADGFEVRLDDLRSALPFRPEPFRPPKRWRGKTVLVELFTNSENPLCLASDLAASGLRKAYPDRYLAVLEYHLPIPRPDPLMNAAGAERREQYRVTSTPTAVIDGGPRIFGGGPRSSAEARYKQYTAQIDAGLAEEPDLKLKAKAVRTGNRIEAEISCNRELPGSEHYAALVQSRERLKGSSGIIIHRFIVRDLVRIDPARGKAVVFDLAAVEKATEAFLTEYEKTGKPEAGFRLPERRVAIDRSGLRVVYFVQDQGSRRILNSVVAEVAAK